MTEIDTHIADLLERARLTAPDAEGDWPDVLERSRRGRRAVRVPVRGVLLAAALLIGVGAVAQAETGVFSLGSHGRSSHHRPNQRLTIHMQRTLRVTEAAYSGIIGTLPRHQLTGIATVNLTTAAKMASVFGGAADRYPDRAGVVLVKGPFSISLYLQGCKRIPTACPAPIGDWAWLAYAVLPSPRTGPRAGLPNVRWVHVAPLGQPIPDLHPLGRVTVQTSLPHGDPHSVDRQHQGAVAIVLQRPTGLTLGRVRCVYERTHYTDQLCQALAEYVAFLHKPRPDEPHPSQGSWTRVSGVIGGWRGNLMITRARLAAAPPALRARIEAGLATLSTKPITRIPPPLRCVRRPDLCVSSKMATIDEVVAVENRHSLSAHTIPVSAVPSRYRAFVPAAVSITGAATNAGDSAAIARRGYVFSMTFDVGPQPASIYVRFRRLLGAGWGVFPDWNVLTLYHPFTPERGLHYRHNLTGFSLLRDLDRLIANRGQAP